MLGQSSPLHVLECFVEWGIANMDKYDVAQSFEQPHTMQPLIHCSHTMVAPLILNFPNTFQQKLGLYS